MGEWRRGVWACDTHAPWLKGGLKFDTTSARTHSHEPTRTNALARVHARACAHADRFMKYIECGFHYRLWSLTIECVLSRTGS